MSDQERAPETEGPAPYWSPYLAGFGLGLTLLASYWLLGTGLGASAAVARVAAWFEHLILPGHVEASAYFGKWFAPGSPHVLKYYLVSMGLGVLLGGFLSARRANRIKGWWKEARMFLRERGSSLHFAGACSSGSQAGWPRDAHPARP